MAKHSEYIDGMLALDASRQFQTHLEQCPTCARYDRTLRKGLRLLSDQSELQPDQDFLHQLHSRIADEENGTYQPISVSAAASVSIAAVLALAAWVPIVMKQMEQPQYLRTSNAVVSAFPNERPRADLVSTTADVSLIDLGYSPLILEAPTAPPSYVRLTSLEMR